MKNKRDETAPPARPRLKKETLRGLGFEELDGVRGGQNHVRPAATRNCLEPITR